MKKKPTTKSKMVIVRVTPKEYKDLKRRARLFGGTVSAFIRGRLL